MSSAVAVSVVLAVLAVGLASVALAALPGVARRWRSLRREVALACTCGHVPARPTARAWRALQVISRCAVWLQIGRVTVSGLENLRHHEVQLVLPTHGHYLDPFVLALVLPESMRCMAARGLLRTFAGLGGVALARCGAFCVDLDAGKAGPALRAAVRLLRDGESVVMFPEGWAYLDGVVRPFRKGAASVARLAERGLGTPISVVPARLVYRAHPGAWINALPTTLQCLTMLIGFPVYRRGVHVTFGVPLSSSELSHDADMATAQLRSAVLALDARATARESA